MRKPYDIVGGFSKQPVPGFDNQTCINMFEYSDEDGKRGKMLLPTSGLDRIKTINILTNTGGWRASFVFKNFVYFVVEQNVYRANKDLIPNFVGSLATNTGYVGIEANQAPQPQIIFVDGSDGYLYNTITGTFTQITAEGFPNLPIDVAYLDGFFVVPDGGTNNFTLSALNDGTVWNALNSAAISSRPGVVKAVRTLKRKLFIFSDYYCEVWENAGQDNFPLRRNNSLLMEYGTLTPASVVAGFDKMFFLSQAQEGLGAIMMVTGTKPIPISNSAITYALNSYETVTDAQGIVYQDSWGIIFYRLNFTSANTTWVFNISQSTPENLKWHTEQMLNGNRHIAQTHFYINENHYFGAYNSGNCYLINNKTFTNDGEHIYRERTGPLLFDESNNRLRIDRLFIDMLQGYANPNNPGFEPLVRLRISRDNGRTFGNELIAFTGKIGRGQFRTFFRKLGVSKNFIFRIYFYDPIDFVMLGASIDYAVLPQ